MHEYVHLPLIMTQCVVAVKKTSGRKPKKVVRGDLRIDEGGNFILTGIICDCNNKPFCYKEVFNKIHLFPKEICRNSKDVYGEVWCCASLITPGKASIKFLEIVAQSQYIDCIKKNFEQVIDY